MKCVILAEAEHRRLNPVISKTLEKNLTSPKIEALCQNMLRQEEAKLGDAHLSCYSGGQVASCRVYLTRALLTLSVLCARSCLQAVHRGRSPKYATF